MTLSDSDLDARLRAAGDLLDDLAADRVSGRGRRRGRRTGGPFALAAAAVLVVAVVGGAIVAMQPSRDGTSHVASGAPPTTGSLGSDPPMPEVSPEAIRALGGTGVVVTRAGLVDLATGETTPLVEPGNGLSDAPMALSDGAGGIYYLSLDPEADPDDDDDFGRMDLRYRDPDGVDEVVEPGARSFALRADGALAVAVQLEPIIGNGRPWLASIVVVAPDGTRTTWTTEAGEYAVTAWAGDRLLVQRRITDTEATDVVILDGPNRQRDLVHRGRVGAIGPDGTWAIVAGLEPGEEWSDSRSERPPRVLDLASGDATGTVDMGDQATGFQAMAWHGDDRLIAASITPPPQAQGLIVEMTVSEEADGTVSVRVTRTRLLDPRTFVPDDAWAGADGTIVALAYTSDQRYLTRLYVCPVDGSDCVLNELPGDVRGMREFLDDPSRPSVSG